MRELVLRNDVYIYIYVYRLSIDYHRMNIEYIEKDLRRGYCLNGTTDIERSPTTDGLYGLGFYDVESTLTMILKIM